MKVSAEWIFNRICDEPERLRAEIEEALRSSPHKYTLDQMYDKYKQRLHFVGLAANLRTAQIPVIEVIDTPYIRVEKDAKASA